MKTSMKVNVVRMFVFVFALMASAVCNAWWDRCGGYYHRGYCHPGGHCRLGCSPKVIVNVPFGGYFPGYYYAASCQMIQTCSYGNCWMTRVCN